MRNNSAKLAESADGFFEMQEDMREEWLMEIV